MSVVPFRSQLTIVRHRQQHVAHLLIFGPAAPPAHHGQRPPLTHGCKHEAVLSTTPTVAMSGKPAITQNNSRITGEQADHLLDNVMRNGSTPLGRPVRGKCGEDVILRFKGRSVHLVFQQPEPALDMEVHVQMRQVWQRVNLVNLT